MLQKQGKDGIEAFYVSFSLQSLPCPISMMFIKLKLLYIIQGIVYLRTHLLTRTHIPISYAQFLCKNQDTDFNTCWFLFPLGAYIYKPSSNESHFADILICVFYCHQFRFQNITFFSFPQILIQIYYMIFLTIDYTESWDQVFSYWKRFTLKTTESNLLSYA